MRVQVTIAPTGSHEFTVEAENHESANAAADAHVPDWWKALQQCREQRNKLRAFRPNEPASYPNNKHKQDHSTGHGVEGYPSRFRGRRQTCKSDEADEESSEPARDQNATGFLSCLVAVMTHSYLLVCQHAKLPSFVCFSPATVPAYCAHKPAPTQGLATVAAVAPMNPPTSRAACAQHGPRSRAGIDIRTPVDIRASTVSWGAAVAVADPTMTHADTMAAKVMTLHDRRIEHRPSLTRNMW